MDSLSGLTPAERLIAALMQPGPVPTLEELCPRPEWMADAACREHPEVNFHPGLGHGYEPARAVCSGCLVELECFEYALDDPELQGCWGGTSPKERDAVRARRGGWGRQSA